jgi:hypothetical protein
LKRLTRSFSNVGVQSRAIVNEPTIFRSLWGHLCKKSQTSPLVISFPWAKWIPIMAMRQWEAASPPFYKCNLPPHAITAIKTEGATLKIDGSNEIGCPYWQGRTRLCQHEDCVWRREDGANECWQILGLVHKLSYNCERDAYRPAGCSIHSKQSYVRAHCCSLKPFSLVAAYKLKPDGWIQEREAGIESALQLGVHSFKISTSHNEIVYWDLTPSMLCMRYFCYIMSSDLDLGPFYVWGNLFTKYVHLVISQVKAAIFSDIRNQVLYVNTEIYYKEEARVGRVEWLTAG